jgi:hypothetical protein
MGTSTNWMELEQRLAAVIKPDRRAVAVTFMAATPSGVTKFAGTEPSGCSFWRLAAEGRTFYTVPENHFNCAVGAYTHNIALSPGGKEKQADQNDIRFGLRRPEEVHRFHDQQRVKSNSVFSAWKPPVAGRSLFAAGAMLLEAEIARSGNRWASAGTPACMALRHRYSRKSPAWDALEIACTRSVRR